MMADDSPHARGGQIEILPDFLRAMPPAQLQKIVDNQELLQSCRLPNGKLDSAKLQAKVNELLEIEAL